MTRRDAAVPRSTRAGGPSAVPSRDDGWRSQAARMDQARRLREAELDQAAAIREFERADYNLECAVRNRRVLGWVSVASVLCTLALVLLAVHSGAGATVVTGGWIMLGLPIVGGVALRLGQTRGVRVAAVAWDAALTWRLAARDARVAEERVTALYDTRVA